MCVWGKRRGLGRTSPHLRCRVVVEESHVELVDAAEHLAQLRVRPRRDHGGHCDTRKRGRGRGRGRGREGRHVRRSKLSDVARKSVMDIVSLSGDVFICPDICILPHCASGSRTAAGQHSAHASSALPLPSPLTNGSRATPGQHPGKHVLLKQRLAHALRSGRGDECSRGPREGGGEPPLDRALHTGTCALPLSPLRLSSPPPPLHSPCGRCRGCHHH